jgi:hypothetical protein
MSKHSEKQTNYGDNQRNRAEPRRETDLRRKAVIEPAELLLRYTNLDAVSERDRRSYAWFGIDESSLPFLSCLDPSTRKEYLKLGFLPGPRRYELGRFAMDEHYYILFEAIPQLRYVGYSEVMEFPPGAPPRQEFDDDISVTERFLQLTKKEDPVPSILLELDDEIDDPRDVKGLKGRDVADMLDAAVVELPELPLVSPPETAAAEPDVVPVCFVGGLNNFKSQYCENKAISYCDNGAQFGSQLVRSSGSTKKRYSHSRVSSCDQVTDVYHWYKAGFWYLVSYPFTSAQQIIPAGWHKYWKHKGNLKLRRKIKIVWNADVSDDGYFRAWTAFYNS